MGGVTYICSDKTGTLTQNKMVVMKCYFLEQISNSGDVYQETFSRDFQEKTQIIRVDHMDGESVLDIIIQSALWNTDARIEYRYESTLFQKNYDVYGTATSQAITNFMIDMKGAKYCFDKQNDLLDSRILLKGPFNSNRKRGTLVVKLSNNKVRVFVKGASEIILDRCTNLLDKEG